MSNNDILTSVIKNFFREKFKINLQIHFQLISEFFLASKNAFTLGQTLAFVNFIANPG